MGSSPLTLRWPRGGDAGLAAAAPPRRFTLNFGGSARATRLPLPAKLYGPGLTAWAGTATPLPRARLLNG
eukprot:9214810-Lingulodinium_polyedra.AAC.1